MGRKKKTPSVQIHEGRLFFSLIQPNSTASIAHKYCPGAESINPTTSKRRFSPFGLAFGPAFELASELASEPVSALQIEPVSLFA